MALNTYEQQLPWAQSPQTVLSDLAPHVPSVVTVPVGVLEAAEEEVAPTMTGSPVVLDEAAAETALEETTAEEAAEETTFELATA